MPIPPILPASKDFAPFVVQWTRDDCDKLEKSGVLDYHYELIEGVILRKMGQNRRHMLSISRALNWLFGAFGADYVFTQGSIFVAHADNSSNKPEPDVALLNLSLDDLSTTQPQPQDIRFLIEIADSTLEYDLGSKATLYARAEIQEYWVVSVEERCLHVHRNPVNGVYERQTFPETDFVALSFAPTIGILISDLLPRPSSLETEGTSDMEAV